MKVKHENLISYVRWRPLLLILRYLRWLGLFILALPSMGKPGYIIFAMPKSGSSFLEVAVSRFKQSSNLPAISTIWRETFYGDTHLIALGKIDIFIANNFNVVIKTHSILKKDHLVYLNPSKTIFLLRDAQQAAKSTLKHQLRYDWHARSEVSEDALASEYLDWTKTANSLKNLLAGSYLFQTEKLFDELISCDLLSVSIVELKRLQNELKMSHPSHYTGLI